LAGGVVLCGCAARPADNSTPVQQPAASILIRSTPAAGSTVAGPVDELKLRFNPPARLGEVTVNGPDGLMPTMVHAVGEVADYSIPLPGLSAGSYTVNWKATAQSRDYTGTFRFSVK
jgi:methionine-rich copper-binding protein CopC